MTDKNGLFGRLALFATALIWGTSFVVLKFALGSMGTMWVLAIRFSVSAILLTLAAGKRLKKMNRTAFKGSVLMGLCLAAAYIIQTFGLVYTTPSKNAFLTATYCVLVPFMAWGIYKRKPNGTNIIAAVLCLAGIGFISLNNGLGQVNVGDMLTLSCGIFYSLQIILMEHYISQGESLSISAVQFTAAAAVCWLGALLFESAPGAMSAEAWAGIMYLSVVCTAVCFFLQAWGMKYTPSSTAAMIMTLESVFGTLFSVLLYHEALTPRLIFGFALVFLAVLISETKLSFLHKRA